MKRKKAPPPWYFDPPSEPELRKWWWRRILYFGGVGILFVSIAFYLGPNVILFGKLTRLAPRDFISHVELQGVPAIKAIKLFERDHGRLPSSEDEVVPEYIPRDQFWGRYLPGEFTMTSLYNHNITYTFTPGREGWYVHGLFTSGRIPLPAVTVEPTSRPATGPEP